MHPHIYDSRLYLLSLSYVLRYIILYPWLQVVAGELELNHECNSMNWSPEDFESKLQVSNILYHKSWGVSTKRDHRKLEFLVGYF